MQLFHKTENVFKKTVIVVIMAGVKTNRRANVHDIIFKDFYVCCVRAILLNKMSSTLSHIQLHT